MHISALLSLSFLIACPETGATVCDTRATVSVFVEVEGPESATVGYTHEGVEAACDANPGGGWFCGYEAAGEITVRATAHGWTPTQATVTVAEDECHVVQEDVMLVMEPADCTLEEFPAFVVDVVGSSGEALTGVAVKYASTSADMDPLPCQHDGETEGEDWSCGWNATGGLEIGAFADGHESRWVVVEPQLTDDGCYPVTQELEMALDWLPD